MGESSDNCRCLVTGQFPRACPKARPLPCRLCSLPAAPVLLREPRDSSLALVSLSDLNEGGWCLTPCSNNSFLLPVSAADRASAQGGRERLSLATKRQPAGHKLSFRHLLPVRERKENKESAHVQALELSLETPKQTWKVKADPLTWQSPFWINSLTCR